MRNKQVELRLVCHDLDVAEITMLVDTDPADPIVSVSRKGYGQARQDLESPSLAILKFWWQCPKCGTQREVSTRRLQALMWAMVQSFNKTGSGRVVVLPLEDLDRLIAATPK